MPAQRMEALCQDKTIPAYVLDFLGAPAVIHFPSSVLILLFSVKLHNEQFHKMLFCILCTATTSLNSIVVFSTMNGPGILIYLLIYLFTYLPVVSCLGFLF